MNRLRTIIPMLLLAGAPAWAEGRVEAVREMDPRGSVSIENLAGSVRVMGWNRNEVKVEARLGRGTEGLEIDSDGDSVDIEVEFRSGRNIDVEGTDLEIWVPRGAEVDVETVSSSVEVEGLTGVLDVETVSGRIRVRGELEEVGLESVSGRIEVESTSSLEDATVETVSGAAVLEGDFHPSGDYEMETVSGVLEVRVPAGFCAEFEVETFSGKIENDLGPQGRRTSEYIPAQELYFSTCSGDAQFTLSSFSGKVRILAR